MYTVRSGLARSASGGGLRRSSVALLVIAVVCATLQIPAFALAADTDAYEPDGTYTTATPVTVGAAAQQHTIAPSGDQDWVSFSVSAGETYMISTTSGTPAEDLDVDLHLYDSDGVTPLDWSDNWGPDETIEYTASSDKTLYARVFGYDSGATGAYAIRVVLATDTYEPDDTYGAATPITVGAAAQQHTIHPDGDEDWVSFPVVAGRTYSVLTASGTLAEDVNVFLFLYDSDGTTQLEYRDENWSSPDEVIHYTATANKTVYARVGGYNTGGYSIRVELPGDAYEPDGSAGLATPITVGGGPQQHTLDPYGDQDWVSFPVVAGLTYRVSSGVEGPGAFTGAALFDSDGTTEIDSGDDPFVDYKADSNKTIYARITGYYADEGAEYGVSVVVISDDYEPDDSYSTAKPVTVNGAVQERSLLPDGDEDWVSIPVTRGWRYTIETGPGTPPQDTDTILGLYDSDGTTEIDYNDDAEGSYSRIVYIAETSRTLYARVTGQWWSDSTYTLSVTAIPVPLISVTQSVDFGTVAVGGSLQKTITISNVGAAPLVIGEAQLVGADFFIVSGNPSGVTIAPDTSRDVVVRYSPTIAYSGAPSAVKRSYTSTIAQYNYVEGSLYSISLFTGFENLGGSGGLPWHVRVGGADSTGSSAVVAGGKYIVEVVVGYSNGSGMVEVLQPVTQNFELERLLGSFLNIAYIRVADASLSIASNASNDTDVSVEMFGTAGDSGDITAPTVPQGVSASAVSPTAIQVSWSASSDASGIKHYLVYDAVTDLLKATVTGTVATISGLTPSTSYSFYVKAVDDSPVANTSGASSIAQATTLAPPSTISLEHDAAGVVFDRFVSGYSTAYSGGGYVYGRWTGTVLKASFTGSSIKWIGPKQPGYGMADVWIDGVKAASNVDCYQAAPGTLSATIWESATLTDGPHTIELRLTGNKNAASSGYVVVLDKFEVTGASPSGGGTRYDDSTASPGYTGTWLPYINPTYVNKTYAYSRWTNAAFTLAFTGTRVSWIGPRTPNYGMADVYIDSVKVATVDTYRANLATQGWREVVWQSGVLAPGAHTLSIRPTGTKNPAATAANVVIDAIDVTP